MRLRVLGTALIGTLLASPVVADEDASPEVPDGYVPQELSLLTEAQRQVLQEVRDRIEVAALRSDEAFLEEVRSALEEYPALADPIAGHAMEMKPSLAPDIMRVLDGPPRDPDLDRRPAPWERPWEGAVPERDDTAADEIERPEPTEARRPPRQATPPEERPFSLGIGYAYQRASSNERFGSGSTRYRINDVAVDFQYAFNDNVSLGVTYLESDSVDRRTEDQGFTEVDGKWQSADLSLRLGSNMRTTGLGGFMGFGLHYDRLDEAGEDRRSGRGFHVLVGAGYSWRPVELRLEAMGRSLSSDLAPEEYNGSRSSAVRLTGSVRVRF